MREQIKFRRYEVLENLQFVHATYINQSFPRHAHDEFVIGVVESGAERFAYRGSKHVVSKGSLFVVNPDEIHTGQAADERGWTYRTLYIDSKLLQQAAREAIGYNKIPFFPELVLQDVALVKSFIKLHLSLEKIDSLLKSESLLLNFLATLTIFHADIYRSVQSIKKESQSVQRVREYIEEHYAKKILLEDLATLANLSKFHLLRVFSSEIGRPPHAYLEQIRINHAKSLLLAGYPIM